MTITKTTPQRVLGAFTLTMINVAAIQSLRNLNFTAAVGWGAIFVYLIAGIGFFIPSALVSAELATGWPKRGVYTWVSEAFGKSWGFVAIWLQWIENVFWYPIVLTFAAGTLSYIINPAWAEKPAYILLIVFLIYWLCTMIDAFGMKISGYLSSFGVLFGTILPAFLIIALGLVWVITGHPNQIPFEWSGLVPDVSRLQNLAFLAVVTFGLAGMEMPAVHAREVQHPQKIYPTAILFSTLCILFISFFGSLAIAFVIPKKELSIVTGITQAFSSFFSSFHLSWLTPVLALAMVFGAVGQVGTWIIGPTKGLLETADDGYIPPLFQKRNARGMPIALLIFQGTVISLLCILFLFMPSVSNSFWILSAIAAILYLLMYLLLFAAAIRLRYKYPHTPRHYRIPGGKTWGMWIVATIGTITCLFGIFVGFLQPEQLEQVKLSTFQMLVGGGVLIMLLLPLLILLFRKEHWKRVI